MWLKEKFIKNVHTATTIIKFSRPSAKIGKIYIVDMSLYRDHAKKNEETKHTQDVSQNKI